MTYFYKCIKKEQKNFKINLFKQHIRLYKNSKADWKCFIETTFN